MMLKQNYDFKRGIAESEIVENYKLIYPNIDMDEYAKYMIAAKEIWDGFTGSSGVISVTVNK
jgi:cell fate (sporulation/competence/biofilm development) regulator YlbF (YheA/YmcA/DUF963 family)